MDIVVKDSIKAKDKLVKSVCDHLGVVIRLERVAKSVDLISRHLWW